MKFHQDVRDVCLDLIGHAREGIELCDGMERGVRFNYNEGVLWRAEDLFTEDEFLREPLKVVTGALLDAARSDYWYTHEKEYEFQEETEDQYEWESDAC